MLAFRLGNINIGDAPSQRYADYDRLAADSDDLKFSFREITRLLQGLKDPINQLIKEAGLNDVLDIKLGKLQPHIFRSTPMPVHVLELHPIPSKSTDTLEKISHLVYNRFAAAGCLTSATSRPRDVLTFLNIARRTYRSGNGYTAKREKIDLKHLYSLDGISQFLSPGSALPKNILRTARFDFGTAQVMGIRLQRVLPEGRQSDPVYDGELKFSNESSYDSW